MYPFSIPVHFFSVGNDIKMPDRYFSCNEYFIYSAMLAGYFCRDIPGIHQSGLTLKRKKNAISVLPVLLVKYSLLKITGKKPRIA